jgi:hypothetical protein
MMRHQELLDEGVLVEGDARRRGQGSATTQKQRREDLEQRHHKLDDATRISEDLKPDLFPERKEGDFVHLHGILSFNVYSLSGYQKRSL